MLDDGLKDVKTDVKKMVPTPEGRKAHAEKGKRQRNVGGI